MGINVGSVVIDVGNVEVLEDISDRSLVDDSAEIHL